MNKISVIIPVYNEELFLESCIKNIYDFVDEIIVIDGSEHGESTDNTESIIKSFGNKIIYIHGKYSTQTGGWDSNEQKNCGIANASGDILVFYSADMFIDKPEIYFNILRDDPDFLVYFCPTIEFWMDMNNMRLYSESTLLSIPSTVLEISGIKRTLSPSFEGFTLKTKDASLDDRLLIPNITKYHLGWIRPFRQQVNKHIRNVKQGRWGKHGDDLLQSTQKLEQWAISHVLSYKQVGHIPCHIELPEILKDFAKINYNVGMEEIIDEYKERYGNVPFRVG